MEKIKFLIVPLALSLFLLPGTRAFAQTTTPEDSYDYNYDYDTTDYTDTSYDYNYGYDDTYDLTSQDAASAVAGSVFAFLFAGVWLVFTLTLTIGTYVFTSLALTKIGQKLEYEHNWYAWVPILNMIMLFQLGDQNPWLLLLMFVPGIGALILCIISIIAYMHICEKRGYDKLLGLLVLIPVAQLVLLGILAWGKHNNTEELTTVETTPVDSTPVDQTPQDPTQVQ